MAKPGTILATDHTMALVRGRVAARPLGPVPVRGLQAPVEVHEISGAVPIRSRLDAGSPARPRSPLLGREVEIARLDAALEAMLAGRGQVVSIVGEAGVGKSRLCLEFARRCRARGCLVIEAPAVSYGRAAGYRPGVELHRRYFQVESGDDPATVRDKVAARLRDLDPELEEGVPAILWVLGVAQDGGGVGAMDPAVRRRYVMRAVHRLVAQQGRRQPFVMILEDMQWVDSETHAAMSAVVEACRPMSWSPAPIAPSTRTPGARTRAPPRCAWRRSRPRPPRRCWTRLLGVDPALAPLKRLVAERASGNPLFLEECVASLVETGALEGEPGAYRFTRPTLALEVPPTVRATIASRIDRLRYEDKRLLQAASVIGDEVPVRLLEAVADVPAEEVRRGLDQLRAAGLLDERALFPDLVYGFRHALVHDVAYESLLHDRRRSLHARILEAIEQLYPATARRADRAPRPPRVPRRGVGPRGGLLPRGRGPHAGAHGELGERVVLRAGPGRARPPAGRRGAGRRPPLRSPQRAGPARPARAQRGGAARGGRARGKPRRPAAAGARALVREQRALGDGGLRRGRAGGGAGARHRGGDRGTSACRSSATTTWGSGPAGARRLPAGPGGPAAQPRAAPARRERRAIRPARHRGGAHPRAARPGPSPSSASSTRRCRPPRRGCGSRRPAATPTASPTRCSGWAAPSSAAATCGRPRACSSAASRCAGTCPRSTRRSRGTSR